MMNNHRPKLVAAPVILRDVDGNRILPRAKVPAAGGCDLRTEAVSHGFYTIAPAPEHRRDLPQSVYLPSR